MASVETMVSVMCFTLVHIQTQRFIHIFGWIFSSLDTAKSGEQQQHQQDMKICETKTMLSHTHIHTEEWTRTKETKWDVSEQQKICKIKVNFKKYINKDMVMDKPA